MLEIRNTEVFGLNRSLRASGNPMTIGEIDTSLPDVSPSDLKRGASLGKAPQGSGHDNYLSGITVIFDVKYSAYWSMEFQRYHWVHILSSQSKMHKLTSMAKDKDFEKMFNKYVDVSTIEKVKHYITGYNNWTESGDKEKAYECFMGALSNLPMGFEMWETISTNYLQIKTIVNQRKNHKLRDDWPVFCNWALELPRFSELTGIVGTTP